MGMKRRMGALAAPAAALLLASCGGGDTGWLCPLWVPSDVLAVDIDGDGRTDVVTVAQLASSASQREGRIVVRRQTAPGAFAAPQTCLAGKFPWKAAAEDMDGDGAPDLVLDSHLTGETGATLLLQDGARPGTFQPPSPIALPGDASAVAVGDLDGDGREDVLARVVLSRTGSISTTALGVLRQRPDGALSPWEELPSAQSGVLSRLLAATDVNGDGTRDVAEFLAPQSTDYRARITTLAQTPGGGGFARVDSSLADVRGIDDAVAADLDGDGRADFATVGFYPGGTSLNILQQQDGTGEFRLLRTVPMPISDSRVAAGDLDADGLCDLVVLGSDNRVFVMGQSTSAPGTFTEPRFLD